MKLTVVCFFWHDDQAKRRKIYTYTPEHVYVLKRMVERHLTIPHKFVCITDSPEEFGGKIDTVLLDKTTFLPGTMLAKLMLWRRDIGSIIGERILYLDLDCVIIGSLDPIVDRPEDVVLWWNPHYKGPNHNRTRYNTSIILITAGARPHLYEDFDPKRHPAELKKFCSGDDQGWVSYKLNWKHEAYWTDKDGIDSVSTLKDWLSPGVSTEPPQNARIIFFAGKRIPQMEEMRAKYPWIRRYI